jgi:dimethylamine monooxygenase subunit A
VASNHVLHQHPFTPFDELPSGDVGSFGALPMPESMLPTELTNEFRHRVGTRPLETQQWLPSDSETEPTIAMKLKLLQDRRNEVVAFLQGGEEVAQEAAELVATFAGSSIQSRGVDALVEAALLVADDLIVMKRTIDSRLVVVAGVVCSPSRWRIETKLGQDMMAVHAPVARYAEHVGGAVDTTMNRLRADQPMIRSNWTIEDHCALFQPIAPSEPLVNDPSMLWVRMERQTLRFLPRTGGSLFTIRTYQQPIAEYVARGKDKAQTLHSLIKRLPDDVAKYKSLLHYRNQLLEWLEPFTK